MSIFRRTNCIITASGNVVLDLVVNDSLTLGIPVLLLIIRLVILQVNKPIIQLMLLIGLVLLLCLFIIDAVLLKLDLSPL
jgi:O-antigen ligase